MLIFAKIRLHFNWSLFEIVSPRAVFFNARKTSKAGIISTGIHALSFFFFEIILCDKLKWIIHLIWYTIINTYVFTWGICSLSLAVLYLSWGLISLYQSTSYTTHDQTPHIRSALKSTTNCLIPKHKWMRRQEMTSKSSAEFIWTPLFGFSVSVSILCFRCLNSKSCNHSGPSLMIRHK